MDNFRAIIAARRTDRMRNEKIQGICIGVKK